MAATVSTTTNAWGHGTPETRQVFYAAGRHWVFLFDGTNLVYSSSVDGATSWAANVSCGAAVATIWSCFWDGTYVHYARQSGASLNTYYRRGIPVSDGTITWSAVEQTVLTYGSSHGWYGCNVYCDSNGKAWIGYLDQNNGVQTPYVVRNGHTDGTWANDTGFPYQLNTTDNGAWGVTMAVLTSGKMYAFYSINGDVLRGKLYNGTAWGSEEATFGTYNVQYSWLTSITSFGDDVLIAYTRDATPQLRSIYRLYGTGWGTDVLVQDSTASALPGLLSVDAAGKFYMFWTGKPTANHIYYKVRTAGSAGTWDADPTDWLTETDVTAYYSMSAAYSISGTAIGVSWVTGTGTPWNVRYGFLTINATYDETAKVEVVLVIVQGNLGGPVVFPITFPILWSVPEIYYPGYTPGGIPRIRDSNTARLLVAKVL